MDAQGAQPNAKEDTVFLALGGTLEDDLSQLDLDLVVSGAGGYESPSTRAALVRTRTVSVRWLATAAEANISLLIHADQAVTQMTWAIGTDNTGSLCLYQGALIGVFIASAPVEAKEYSISWAMRDNPDTTGAADAKISEVLIYNHTDGVTTELTQFTHSAPTTNVSWALSVGGWYDGVGLSFTPTNAPTKARVSRAFHPHVEAFEDWVGPRSAYAGDADDGTVEPLGPIPIASALGNSGYFAGRGPWAYHVAHSLALRRRSWAPLVNEVYNDAAELLAVPTPAEWALAPPGDAGMAMMLQYLRWVPCPAEATHAWVRAHVVSFVVAGAPVEVEVAIYAMNRPQTISVIDNNPAPALEWRVAKTTLTVDHGDAAATGEWLELGYVQLPKFQGPQAGWPGTVWLTLAYAIDPDDASGNDDDARLIIDAWHARPVNRPTPADLDP